MTPITLDRLPKEILQSTRCVLWNFEERGGEPTKVPYVPTRPEERASSTDPATWDTFDKALTAYLDGKSDGIGWNLGDGFAGVDIDKCRDPDTGTITAEAQAIIAALDSYAEISPSGTGVKVFLRGCLPPGRRRKGPVEMYDSARFFTVTGRHLDGTPATIEERTAQLAALHGRLFSSNGTRQPRPGRRTPPPVSEDDAALIERARHARNGDTVSRLWAGDISGHPSHSEADLALCSHLAFWTDRNPERIDALFRLSGLMRPKWDERHGAETYGALTIAKAIGNCHETYCGPGQAQTTTRIIEHLTDLGNARRLVARYGQDLRYSHACSAWLAWDGTRWCRDETEEASRRAKDVVRGIYAEASAHVDEAQRKALAKHAMKCEADSKVRALLSMAQSEPELVARPAEFDRDPWLLNVLNGTLELRTGTLREHRREDLITKLVPMMYDTKATAPTWEAFLGRIFDKDGETIGFVRRAVGYSLTGSTREQVWFLLHGAGSNGKSTLLRTLTDLLADYAVWTPAQTLLAKRGEHIENDLARLRGARLVGSIEPEGGRRLAEALVKQLTGGDPVTARFLYSEYFSFIPEFKLWFGTNHRPEIRGTDHAVWRRIRLVPFTMTIPDDEQDRDLPEKLRAEFPGILRWAVEGCLAWQRHGLGWAAEVRKATEEYRISMDVIGNFLMECTIIEAGASVGATDLYRAYVEWCDGAKEHPETQRRFGDALSERGFAPGRHTVTNRKIRRGLRMVSEQSEQSEPLFGKVP